MSSGNNCSLKKVVAAVPLRRRSEGGVIARLIMDVETKAECIKLKLPFCPSQLCSSMRPYERVNAFLFAFEVGLFRKRIAVDMNETIE